MTTVSSEGVIKIPAKNGNYVITLADASGNPVTHDICGNPITSDMFYIDSVKPYNKPLTGKEKRENKRLQRMMNEILERTKNGPPNAIPSGENNIE